MANFDFVQNPIVPGMQQNVPNGMSINQQQQQYNQYQQQRYQPSTINTTPVAPPPKISSGGFKFTVKPDEDEEPVDKSMVLENPVVQEVTEKRHVGRPRKSELTETAPSNIVRADATVEPTSTLQTYIQTNQMLNMTLNQIDCVAAEVKEEFDQVKASRTLKRKYDYLVGLGNSLSQLINTKGNVIREINNTITKSNELDYRREKDRRESEAGGAGDDKYIMDLYNSFIKNPMGQTQQIAPDAIATTSMGMPNIIRANVPGQQMPQGQPMDAGYLNYLSNMSPEQNLMYYEQDPNVKTVVVFDAATGNKFFQVMNVATGQAIPNVPALDNRFMEDTTIDIRNKIAKNNNLHETYPVIVINENISKEY